MITPGDLIQVVGGKYKGLTATVIKVTPAYVWILHPVYGEVRVAKHNAKLIKAQNPNDVLGTAREIDRLLNILGWKRGASRLIKQLESKLSSMLGVKIKIKRENWYYEIKMNGKKLKVLTLTDFVKAVMKQM